MNPYPEGSKENPMPNKKRFSDGLFISPTFQLEFFLLDLLTSIEFNNGTV